ncbi:hypothetical protein [Paramagnetospirillum caucaseum]|uniref:hypothetical protein n=1 Tax=Paramagnetospirillum caucaseum TaxID=1244869 RepID=UPI000346C408|nr:hypothetical protein [Paramagnetospirillum caucaseum]
MISFNTIPIDLRSSGQYVEYNNSRAGQKLVGMPVKILLIGQKLSNGSVAMLQPTRVANPTEAAGLVGKGSQLYAMVAALKAANTSIDTWMIALPDDAAALAASGGITFNAAAPVSGTFTLRLDGIRIRIAIAAGQAVASMATALAASINADPALPVTATSAAGVVTWTCRWKGATGNAIDARVGHYEEEAPPAGLDYTFTAMAGGTADPDVGDALAVVAGDWYTDIVCPYADADNITQLEADGERRWGGTVMTDAHYYVGKHGTYGALATFGNTRNSPNLTYIGGYEQPVVAVEMGGGPGRHLRL